jgi:hypothetical protein
MKGLAKFLVAAWVAILLLAFGSEFVSAQTSEAEHGASSPDKKWEYKAPIEDDGGPRIVKAA